jgi:hypothetical protein
MGNKKAPTSLKGLKKVTPEWDGTGTKESLI